MTLELNTCIEMFENIRYVGTYEAKTVIATIAAVKPQRIGVRYIIQFELPKRLNGKPVPCTRVISDRDLTQCFVREVKPARKGRRTVERGGKLDAA